MKNKDPKHLGIPNINFSLTKKKDEREKKFLKQRLERGFDDSETWSLDCTIASFLIPRLERLMEISDSDKEIRDSILKSMKLIVRNHGDRDWTEKEEKIVFKGIRNLSKYFLKLWW